MHPYIQQISELSSVKGSSLLRLFNKRKGCVQKGLISISNFDLMDTLKNHEVKPGLRNQKAPGCSSDTPLIQSLKHVL